VVKFVFRYWELGNEIN
jgi:hypothetical protein